MLHKIFGLFVLAPIFYPFLLLIILLNEIARRFVSLILLLLYGRSVELVGEGADGFWGYKKEGGSRNVLTFFTTPKNTMDRHKIAKFYIDKIQRHRDSNGNRVYAKCENIMKEKLGYFCWEKSSKSFNVYNHIRVLKKKVYRRKDLEELLSQLSVDMKEDKPQWKIIILQRYSENDEDGGKCVVICRFLHCYMDGMSLIMLFKEHVAPSMEYTIDPLKFSIPLWKRIIFHVNALLYAPLFFTTTNLQRFFATVWIKRDKKYDEKKRKYFGWAAPISEVTLNKIRTRDGSSVTNVLSTAIVNSLKETLPRERLVKELLINELVAYLPYPHSHPQNRFAYFTYPLGEREKRIFGPDILSTFYMFRLAGRLPSFLGPLWLEGSSASLLLSNAPFSRKKVCLRDGTPLLKIGAFTPQPNDIGLSITSTRYGEELYVFGCADSSCLSQEDLNALLDQVPKEIDKMWRNALNKAQDFSRDEFREQISISTQHLSHQRSR